jgi:hypothetical protein
MKLKLPLKNPRLWYLIGLLVIDAVFFTATNPRTVPSFLLIIGLLLLIATLYWLYRALLLLAGVYIRPLRQQRRRLAVFLTATSAVLLALQSIQQLSLRDALVIVPLAVVLYIYVTFMKSRPVR